MVSFLISLFRCSLRILDSFGTEPEFNYAEYPEDELKSGTLFGGLDVHLRQILNMFRKKVKCYIKVYSNEAQVRSTCYMLDEIFHSQRVSLVPHRRVQWRILIVSQAH